MEINLRAMSMKEYNEYEDYVDKLQSDKDITISKRLRLCAAWVCKHIYNLDVEAPENKALTPATVIEILNQTMQKSDTVDEAQLKNFVKSGIGAVKAEQNTAKPAAKEQK